MKAECGAAPEEQPAGVPGRGAPVPPPLAGSARPRQELLQSQPVCQAAPSPL